MWAITADEMATFDRIFQHFDKNKTGKVSDEEMQKLIKQTKLDQKICAKVWDLTSPDEEEYFSKPHFFMCMLLLSRAKNGAQLPDELPAELKASSGFSGPTQAPMANFQQQNLPPPQMPQPSGPPPRIDPTAEGILAQMKSSLEALRNQSMQNNAILNGLRMQNNTLEMKIQGFDQIIDELRRTQNSVA